VQRGSLVIDLPTLENLLPKEKHNLPHIKDFPTSQRTKHHNLQQTSNINNLIELVWLEVLNTSTKNPTLLSSLKVIRGKQHDMLAQGLVGLEYPNDQHFFPMNHGDNSLKMHKSVFESKGVYSHNSKDKTTKIIHI
jgi:hypothetical protein